MSVLIEFIDEGELRRISNAPPSPELQALTLHSAVRDFFAFHNTDYGHLSLRLSHDKNVRLLVQVEPCDEYEYHRPVADLEEGNKGQDTALCLDFKIDRAHILEWEERIDMIDASLRAISPNKMICYQYVCKR